MPYGTRKIALIRSPFVAGVLLVLLVLLVGGCEQAATDGAGSSVATTAGEQVDLADSQWLVVNYWAEWCAPCRHEIPELNELDGSSFGNPPVGISVLGVNYDGLVDERLADISERMGIRFAVLATDPRERWQQPTPTVLPSTYLIAPGGEFVETLVGPQTRAGIVSRIETLAQQ